MENTGETKYLLVQNINPGGIAGGSAAQYFVGDWGHILVDPMELNDTSILNLPPTNATVSRTGRLSACHSAGPPVATSRTASPPRSALSSGNRQ
ncbi:hypothetical protein M728_003746 (plasmid) [Ensifer sp. WSM1721]|uniref:hypothetical protein n=1 Tax=Ensifer sp. WSM1721 TaxID=1041159 RepID=UPI00047DCDDC|nr:hypothetical protein [Ensifer sp. WSM1721]